MRTVLSKINQSTQNGQRKVYKIGFFKKNGEFRELRVTRHSKKGIYEADKSEGSRYNYSLNEKGLLIIENVDATNERDRTKTPLVCLLLTFEGIRIHHDC